MLSELVFSFIFIFISLIPKLFKTNKWFRALLFILIIGIYCIGLTANTPQYRAFLIFIGIYYSFSIGINTLLYCKRFTKVLNKRFNDLVQVNTVKEYKNLNINVRILIYLFAIIFSITDYSSNKLADINNVFTTIIIFDVLVDLLLTKYFDGY
ncbi:hypothetical protein [Staphylococcus hominis]|uniref:hypothetical protein n=1 Tax=Staphylococcus hominis TaxID=1290 RepID=UPI001F570F61|nr:hypothetical protein [Staphylococcus hominis]MCI2848329.1 hypothetical protein [Staphylococcus hominis]MCI2849732.1 hypothetical protein [Staphylococcus hominis]MCI2855861.1 hypothetical protein [Staphylococcus hominis]